MWLERLEAAKPYQKLRFGMNRGLVNFFRQALIAGGDNLRIAEVACGSGYASHVLAQEATVSLSVAADVSLEDFKQARIEHYRASFVRMDLFNPALRQGSLDLVWNSSSIEEIDRPQEAVAAMAWLARAGGWVFVGVPHRFGLPGWLHLLPSKRTRAWLGHPYTRNELRALLSSAGLEVRREITYFFGAFIGSLAQKTP